MDGMIDRAWLVEQLEAAEAWVQLYVLDWANLAQAAVVVAAFVLARVAGPRLAALCRRYGEREGQDRMIRRAILALALLAVPLVWLALQWLSLWVAQAAGWPHRLLILTVSLLAAWVVIRLTSQLVRDPVWSHVIAVIAWVVAALNIVGLLDPAAALLDAAGTTVGDVRISLLTVIKAAAVLALLLWAVGVVSRLVESQLERSTSVTASAKVLVTKLLKVGLIALAVVVALETVGLDLTALAVFTGALGLGIGFGLQKVVSNLISGVILLLDRSIKPGDVVYVTGTDGPGTYGWINAMRARYVSVITRDGTEYLIPNEELIVQRVENWSYTSRLVRLKLPIGIAYASDPRKAIALIVEAAMETDRVKHDPAPRCLVKGFGDSSVELELRFWIDDVNQGVANVKSAILLRVWDKFHASGIEIPFPQRDLHLRSAEPITVRREGE